MSTLPDDRRSELLAAKLRVLVTRRWEAEGRSFIVMDAPPEKEPLAPWLAVQRLLYGAGITVPRLESVDAAEGFVLMEDFGDLPYAGNVSPESAHERYAQALGVLAAMQALTRPDWLPEYDREKLLAELRLFPEYGSSPYMPDDWDWQEGWWYPYSTFRAATPDERAAHDAG